MQKRGKAFLSNLEEDLRYKSLYGEKNPYQNAAKDAKDVVTRLSEKIVD